MLGKLNKNLKEITKLLPENFFTITSKSAVYAGLSIYWLVIIFGTFFQL